MANTMVPYISLLLRTRFSVTHAHANLCSLNSISERSATGHGGSAIPLLVEGVLYRRITQDSIGQGVRFRLAALTDIFWVFEFSCLSRARKCF